jgi:hypothetical protein
VNRNRIDDFDRQFSALHRSCVRVALDAGNDLIYKTEEEHETDLWPISVGTYLIRSAAIVEQTFNGITTRLWDDPFEWTLPERLPTVTDLIGYMEEVQDARIRGFAFLRSDDDLDKSIPAPTELKTLAELLTGTLDRSSKHLFEARSLLMNYKNHVQ